jgi:hypothetical protein
MSLYVVVHHPRFGDTARVVSDERHLPQLVADIGTGGALSIKIDDGQYGVGVAACGRWRL